MKNLLMLLTALLTLCLAGCGTITTDTTPTEPTTADIELRDEQQLIADMLYDLLIIEYATESCTQEELQGYIDLYAELQELEFDDLYEETLYEISLLLDMIYDQVRENNIAEREQ